MKKSRNLLLLLLILLIASCASTKDIERDKAFLQQYQKSDPGNIQKTLDTLFDKKVKLGMNMSDTQGILGPPLANMEHYLVGNQGTLSEWVYKEGLLIFHNGKLINVSYKLDGKLYLPPASP
jgi:hypothetical protein